ncbi:hypothetical protein P4377_07025 [Bacillus thuringiensis]|nr:hypothetical protein [Bacillus thuringiensis]
MNGTQQYVQLQNMINANPVMAEMYRMAEKKVNEQKQIIAGHQAHIFDMEDRLRDMTFGSASNTTKLVKGEKGLFLVKTNNRSFVEEVQTIDSKSFLGLDATVRARIREQDARMYHRLKSGHIKSEELTDRDIELLAVADEGASFEVFQLMAEAPSQDPASPRYSTEAWKHYQNVPPEQAKLGYTDFVHEINQYRSNENIGEMQLHVNKLKQELEIAQKSGDFEVLNTLVASGEGEVNAE